MNLLKALSTVSALTLLSRITGLVRESLKAVGFGAGLQMDAFEAAFRLPNMLRRLFAEGAFSQAFVPILAEYKRSRGEDATRDLVGGVATLARPNDPIETDARLKEADYGEWEGHTIEELEELWGAARRMWEADPASFAIPGGESGSDVARRARSFVEALVEWEQGLEKAEEDHRVLVVAHSTLNRVLLAVCLGVPLRDYRRRFRQDGGEGRAHGGAHPDHVPVHSVHIAGVAGRRRVECSPAFRDPGRHAGAAQCLDYRRHDLCRPPL